MFICAIDILLLAYLLVYLLTYLKRTMYFLRQKISAIRLRECIYIYIYIYKEPSTCGHLRVINTAECRWITNSVSVA